MLVSAHAVGLGYREVRKPFGSQAPRPPKWIKGVDPYALVRRSGEEKREGENNLLRHSIRLTVLKDLIRHWANNN